MWWVFIIKAYLPCFSLQINEAFNCLTFSTSQNLEQEARCMTKARRLGVSTPVLFAVDPLIHTLTWVSGGLFCERYFSWTWVTWCCGKRLDNIATQIGDAIGKLHDGGLIHGDLTTSNMLIHNVTNQLVSNLGGRG